MADFGVQYSPESYCAICDQSFPSNMERGEHVASSPMHPYCETCDRRFLNKNILRNHYTYSPRHYYCASCRINFQTAAGLRVHIEHASVHSDDSDDEDTHPDSLYFIEGQEDEIGQLRYPDESSDEMDDESVDDSWEHYDECDFEDEEDLGDTPSNGLPDVGETQEEDEEPSISRLEFTCPICELVPRTVCSTPCGHLFCVPCIRQVYRQQGSCPVCDEAGAPVQLRKLYISV